MAKSSRSSTTCFTRLTELKRDETAPWSIPLLSNHCLNSSSFIENSQYLGSRHTVSTGCIYSLVSLLASSKGGAPKNQCEALDLRLLRAEVFPFHQSSLPQPAIAILSSPCQPSQTTGGISSGDRKMRADHRAVVLSGPSALAAQRPTLRSKTRTAPGTRFMLNSAACWTIWRRRKAGRAAERIIIIN
ncbi:hypothetical protein SAMN04488093_11632 [Tropicibacter naphthalenivorans]|uniref:Uncharacterized protein n=1 Tax=Tropicibacter naphthalenivorans TaxID=441103 RepID=A0A0P1GJI8_9RHOB|nr:hypothetical protein TRN7648_03744 [Tropicibacter naphthalenivorans]SMD07874.1 hypothetical protein SAMN04488093_11632 [Tropicibacter naphthalenivorans]